MSWIKLCFLTLREKTKQWAAASYVLWSAKELQEIVKGNKVEDH